MTPAERARAWYPAASIGGGNTEANFKGVGNKFLWKPKSESTGKCAVHTPAGVRIASLTVGGKTYGVGSYGNGYRPLFRLDKAGSAYGSNVQVTMNLHGGGTITVTVPNGGQRFEKSGFKDSDSSPAQPPAPAPVASINLPASYAAKVGLVAAINGRKFHACTRDDANPARWTHSGRQAGLYGVRWNVKPPGSIATYNAGIFGLWSVTDGKRFLSLGEIIVELTAGKPTKPPVVETPAPVKPPAVDRPAGEPPAGDAVLTATGLRLAPDLVPLVAKVLVLTNAKTPSKTVKYMARQSGAEWSTGTGLQTYPAAVYQIFWAKEPPASIPHHQGFPGAIKNVSHVTQAGKWEPPTTRNP